MAYEIDIYVTGFYATGDEFVEDKTFFNKERAKKYAGNFCAIQKHSADLEELYKLLDELGIKYETI